MPQDRNLEFSEYDINAVIISAAYASQLTCHLLRMEFIFYKLKHKTLAYILYKRVREETQKTKNYF